MSKTIVTNLINNPNAHNEEAVIELLNYGNLSPNFLIEEANNQPLIHWAVDWYTPTSSLFYRLLDHDAINLDLPYNDHIKQTLLIRTIQKQSFNDNVILHIIKNSTNSINGFGGKMPHDQAPIFDIGGAPQSLDQYKSILKSNLN